MNPENFLLKVKPGTLAIIIIVLAVGAYFLFKKTKEDTNQTLVDNITVDPTKFTQSSESLDILLNQIFNAMNVTWPGCDNAAILASFAQCNSLDDLNYIIKNFGTKEHFLNGEATNFAEKLLATNLNLMGWLNACCNDDTLIAVNAIFVKFGLNAF